MPRRITPKSALENLKREAKRWLHALRDNVGEARARLERILPDAPAVPGLRHVQHALAREHGFPGWPALKAHLATRDPVEPERRELVSRFLDNACPDHHVRGGTDHLRARSTAMRMLARYPEIATASFYTEVVCGNLDAVTRALDERPELVSQKDAPTNTVREDSGGEFDLYRDLGAKGWEPLLYLCFARLPLDSVTGNAVTIARTLLDRGANPNAFFMAGGSRYTPLVGAIGEGEEGRPAHQQRDALVRLLLERGAEPFDIQVVYNIHFTGNVLWFLELIYEYSVKGGRQAAWDDPEWKMLDMGGYGSGARWHLEIAVKNNNLKLAEWCLAHGANPNAPPSRAARRPKQSLYEEAVRRGHTELAEVLVRHGATRTEIEVDPKQAFVAACMRLDRDEVRRQLAAHPEYLEAPEPLFEAARRNRVDVARFLLDLGMSPNVQDAAKERPLHQASYHDGADVAQLLIEHGAEIDPVGANYDNTPLGAASYSQSRRMIDLLGRYSSDVWELTYAGKVERLREVLSANPEKARIVAGSHTPLMWLPPDDETRAIEIARLYLSHGADPTLRNKEGMTAADRAHMNGMYDLADLLRRAAPGGSSHPDLERYDRMVANLLDAYRTGTPEAMERHWNDSWHRRSWDAMRRYVQLDVGKRPEREGADVEITLDDARLLVAREQGFGSWQALGEYVATRPADARTVTDRPVTLLSMDKKGATTTAGSSREWETIIEMMREKRIPALRAEGQMTDPALYAISGLEHVVSLDLGGSKKLTDAGVRCLAWLPHLRHLALNGTGVTDEGLASLAGLTELETLDLSWTAVTDAGVAHFKDCQNLARVNLSATRTGDAAIKAFAGKPKLAHFRSGAGVTDAGPALFHEFPVFKRWQGGEPTMALLSADAGPSYLGLRGSFTDKGLAALAGLEGLFALNVDDSRLAITAAGLAALVPLPSLGWLAFDAKDDAMPYIAAMPRLRFLMCQDSETSDDGWVALSRSRSIAYIWGRRCHGLRARGFRALSTIPTLESLSVSCLNVDDAALSALPSFPALRELMPMDVPDAGYRHIAGCERLDSLILMYCRETTDLATEHIAGLSSLKKYFASYTKITDRTPEIFASMSSLEEITLSGCPGVTNAGIATLAVLPRLQKLELSGMQSLTRDVLAALPPRIQVDYAP